MTSCVCHRDMVTKSMRILPLKVSVPQKDLTNYVHIFSSTSSSFSFSTRTAARVIGTVLEDGVGAAATHYCDAHQLCGGWEGES